jgi:hypothetical protein
MTARTYKISLLLLKKDSVALKRKYRNFSYTSITQTRLDSMVWVGERTIPTEPPPLVGEVIANFLLIEGGHRDWIPMAVFSVF